jgi:limonene-1,2-epoxide hydrolase
MVPGWVDSIVSGSARALFGRPGRFPLFQLKFGAFDMRPKELVQAWVEAFNKADVPALVSFYSETAINHQVAETPVEGREAIRQMFEAGFASAKMVCAIENIFEDGDWAILEWRDPLGLRGCGFFHFSEGKIVFQRGYWDKLTFLRQHNLPIPDH